MSWGYMRITFGVCLRLETRRLGPRTSFNSPNFTGKESCFGGPTGGKPDPPPCTRQEKTGINGSSRPIRSKTRKKERNDLATVDIHRSFSLAQCFVKTPTGYLDGGFTWIRQSNSRSWILVPIHGPSATYPCKKDQILGWWVRRYSHSKSLYFGLEKLPS